QAADIVAPADYLDIDLFLKAAGFADFDIRFAEGKMVLAYCLSAGLTGSPCGGTSKQSGAIADVGTFAPTSPTSDAIPNAASTWYQSLSTSGVTIGGSHLYLDPSGYRAPMIFRLAQSFYKVPNLYDNLLEHYFAIPATLPSSANKLGAQYDYQFIYQNNAYANYLKDTANYRYVNLPDDINLGNPEENHDYRRAMIVTPDLFGTGFVTIPATRVEWGVTMLKKAPNRANAVKFLQFLLGPDGQNNLTTYGPAPIIPAEVSRDDYWKLPAALYSLVYVTHDDD
ncbi:MAG TPA: substrate-binding domain-containing protein, partial [Syntrophorhabdales bacterium]|nr:substrate-binding domain-containing protein [Syntrophorhabdales bacterium]